MSGEIALLDILRPPLGHKTTFAVTATYSLDLVACAASLLALDGRAHDDTSTPLAATLRAIRRLDSRVRIIAQQGGIGYRPSTEHRLMALLDRIVRVASFDRTRQSFHPKVWVVRQGQGEEPAIWKLVVGSRNLSSDASWDLGLSVEGAATGRRTNLPGLGRFVAHALSLAGEAEFGSKELEELARVQWGDGNEELDLQWSAGSEVASSAAERRAGGPSLPGDALDDLPDAPDRVLVLSPFVDAEPLQRVADRWPDLSPTKLRLVGGSRDLEKVAARAEKILARFDARYVDRFEEDAPPAQDVRVEDGDEHVERGLHAKAVVVWKGASRARVVMGSPNLTDRAWQGRNVEAWAVFSEPKRSADALWKWSDEQTAKFRATGVPPPEDSTEDRTLLALHDAVASRRWQLDERGPASILRVDPSARLLPDAAYSLFVARLSTPSVNVAWRDGADVSLPRCSEGERTRLMVMTLRGPTESVRWVQAVELEPDLGEARDGAALAELLTPERLSDFIWALLDERAADSEAGEPGREAGGNTGRSGRADGNPPLRLESLLHALGRAEDADRDDLVRSIDRLITDYRQHAKDTDSMRLAELVQVWTEIKKVSDARR